MSHIEIDELALYTAGHVTVSRAKEIEAHVETCDACATSLQHEARIEEGVRELTAQPACIGCDRVVTGERCDHCGAAMRVGEFRILEIRVQNQHGRLYLAEDAAGTQVALKELCFMQAPSFDALDAFEREARILCALHHPCLPRFISSFQVGEGVHTRLYLAQEFIEGESLEERLANNYFSEREVVSIARQVLEILAFLQNRSPMVIHRDVKPANLIRRPDGRIVLVDFGAARDQGSTAGATQVGTFGYMPIEQLAGLVDATTDVYALGVSVMRLLTRREPWKLLDDPWKHMNVSPPLRRVLRRMTERRPEDRYASATAALNEVIGLGRSRARKRPIALTIGLSVTLTIGALAAFKATRVEAPEEAPIPAKPRINIVEEPVRAVTPPLPPRRACTNTPFTTLPIFYAVRERDQTLMLELLKEYLDVIEKRYGELPSLPKDRLQEGLLFHDGDLNIDRPTRRVVIATGNVKVTGWAHDSIVIAGGCIELDGARRSLILGGGGVTSKGNQGKQLIAGPEIDLPEEEALDVLRIDRAAWKDLLDRLGRVVSKTTCDEVSCVLSNYEGPCCGKFKKGAPPITTSDVPDALDRQIIAEGMKGVKAAVMACGDRSPAKGTVKVSVKVEPVGTIGSITVKQTPDAALGACVAAAIAKTRFAKTLAGGTFSYPFVF